MKRALVGVLLLLALLGVWAVGGGPPGDAPPTGLDPTHAPAEAPQRPPALRGVASSAPPGVGPAGAEASTPPPTAARGPGITGLVLGADGAPAVRLGVELRHAAGATAHTFTDAEGRFRFPATPRPAPEGLEVVVRPDGRRVERAAVRAVEPGEDVRIVLEAWPHLTLEVVDATTGRGPRTRSLVVVHRVGATENPFASTSRTDVLDNADPFVFRWVIRHEQPGEQVQVRAQGYAPSAWIDPPTQAEPAPRVVELRPDPGSVGALDVRVRTADGSRLEHVGVAVHVGRGTSRWSRIPLTDGHLVWPLAPGAHRLQVGGIGVKSPELPHAWYVAEEIAVEVARGETVHRDVLLVRGGFLRLPREAQGRLTLRHGEKSEEVYGHARHDEDGWHVLLGPLRPGSWGYAYDEDGTPRTGTAEIVAGEVVHAAGE